MFQRRPQTLRRWACYHAKALIREGKGSGLAVPSSMKRIPTLAHWTNCDVTGESIARVLYVSLFLGPTRTLGPNTRTRLALADARGGTKGDVRFNNGDLKGVIVHLGKS